MLARRVDAATGFDPIASIASIGSHTLRTMLIAQISDCHIVEPGRLFADRIDSSAGLRAAIEVISHMDRRPDLVLATGDLVNDGTSAQYDQLEALLGGLDVPVIPIMGNHDDRDELRSRFDVVPNGDPDEPVCFVVDDHPVRFVVIDTTVPGRHDGALDHEQLAWLDERLSDRPQRPTVVVQHHPPFVTGLRPMDRHCGFADSAPEVSVLSRHRHVEAVVAGHLHRMIVRRVGPTVAMTCPSTAAALALDLDDDIDDAPIGYSTEPTGLLLHEWGPTMGLVTHVVAIGDHQRWSPPF